MLTFLISFQMLTDNRKLLRYFSFLYDNKLLYFSLKVLPYFNKNDVLYCKIKNSVSSRIYAEQL